MKGPPADDGDVYLGGIRVLVVDGSNLVRATVTAIRQTVVDKLTVADPRQLTARA